MTDATHQSKPATPARLPLPHRRTRPLTVGGRHRDPAAAGPRYRTGDLWGAYGEADLVLVPTDSVVEKGRLVMRGGAARDARVRFPGLNGALGRQIRAGRSVAGVYGLIVSPQWPDRKIGAFQTRLLYEDWPDLEILRTSVSMLRAWCQKHPEAKVSLPYPGGWRDDEVVTRILFALPDTVTIWRKDAP